MGVTGVCYATPCKFGRLAEETLPDRAASRPARLRLAHGDGTGALKKACGGLSRLTDDAVSAPGVPAAPRACTPQHFVTEDRTHEPQQFLEGTG